MRQPQFSNFFRSSMSRSVRRTSADRKSTRLNSSHSQISYAVFCLKKKKNDLPAPLPSAANPLVASTFVSSAPTQLSQHLHPSTMPDCTTESTYHCRYTPLPSISSF